MSDSFGTNDDGRRLYGHELAIECSKYSDAINDLMWCGLYDVVGYDDIFGCIIGEVMDLDHEIVSNEGITKGELHKRNRERFARGVFKAFFDEKIIDEGQYDRLFRNLRANLLMDYWGKEKERKRLLEDYMKSRKEEERLFAQYLSQGVKLRSGRVLPPNENPD